MGEDKAGSALRRLINDSSIHAHLRSDSKLTTTVKLRAGGIVGGKLGTATVTHEELFGRH